MLDIIEETRETKKSRKITRLNKSAHKDVLPHPSIAVVKSGYVVRFKHFLRAPIPPSQKMTNLRLSTKCHPSPPKKKIILTPKFVTVFLANQNFNLNAAKNKQVNSGYF